ncbi:hypothetical protein [Yeosuana marina]|uniref:hypothetical protein n=1 Tax=Yeosuana marina TaxID=1565536 RepID=UPI00142449F5|nr:hypothetical protein [Yeosuana marina]
MEQVAKTDEKNIYVSNLDVLVNKARSIRDSIHPVFTKHDSFNDNFGRFLVKLTEAQFYLDEMNRECWSDEREFILDIIDKNQESSDK